MTYSSKPIRFFLARARAHLSWRVSEAHTASGPLSDVYLTAYLAGGPRRVTQALVARLTFSGRVRVQPNGYYLEVDGEGLNGLECTAYELIRDNAYCFANLYSAICDLDETRRLEEKLEQEQLLGTARGEAVLRATRERGSQALRVAGLGNTELPRYGDFSVETAASVALYGPKAVTDRKLRRTMFTRSAFRVPESAGGGGG